MSFKEIQVSSDGKHYGLYRTEPVESRFEVAAHRNGEFFVTMVDGQLDITVVKVTAEELELLSGMINLLLLKSKTEGS